MEEHARSENMELPGDSEMNPLAGVEFDGIDGTPVTLPVGTILRVITSEQLEQLRPMLINNGLIASNVFDEYNPQIHYNTQGDHLLQQELHNVPGLIPIEPNIDRKAASSTDYDEKHAISDKVDTETTIALYEQAKLKSTLAKAARTSVLPVKCKNTLARLYKDKFGSGSRGKCIKYRRDWYTPREFEIQCGKAASRDWKRSIRYEGKKLHDLIDAGIITVHSISCTCCACCDDESATGPILISPPLRKRRSTEEIKKCKEEMKRCKEEIKKKTREEINKIMEEHSDNESNSSHKKESNGHNCPKADGVITNDPIVNPDQFFNKEKTKPSPQEEPSISGTAGHPDLAMTLQRINNISQTVVLLVTQVNKCIEDVKHLKARQLWLEQRQVAMETKNIETKRAVAQVQHTEDLDDATKLIASDLISMAYSGV